MRKCFSWRKWRIGKAFLIKFWLMLRCGNDVSMAIGGRVGGERLMAQFLDSKIAGDRYSFPAAMKDDYVR